MLEWLGPALGAVGSFFGASKNSEAIQQANAAQMAMAEKNIALQREFATHGIRWKAADAKAAGIHPLYALGASTTSFSPVSVGVTPDTSMGNAFASMGQNLGRAASALVSPGGKVGAIDTITAQQELQANNLRLENMQLQNTLLKSRIANVAQPGTPPGVAFDVPENPKPEQRPPLMIGGKRWDTNPDTSPMKAWEDQYGDEGPASWTLPWFIAAQDFQQNYGKPATWPSQVLRWGANAVWQDLLNEGRNARRFFRRYLPDEVIH